MENEKSIRAVLAANLRKYRKLKNLTQSQLAEYAGCSAQYIGNIECMNNWVSDVILEKIAKVLGISVYELFLEENENKHPVVVLDQIIEAKERELQQMISTDINAKLLEIKNEFKKE